MHHEEGGGNVLYELIPLLDILTPLDSGQPVGFNHQIPNPVLVISQGFSLGFTLVAKDAVVLPIGCSQLVTLAV